MTTAPGPHQRRCKSQAASTDAAFSCPLIFTPDLRSVTLAPFDNKWHMCYIELAGPMCLGYHCKIIPRRDNLPGFSFEEGT